jgi:hypothetical protein
VFIATRRTRIDFQNLKSMQQPRQGTTEHQRLYVEEQDKAVSVDDAALLSANCHGREEIGAF